MINNLQVMWLFLDILQTLRTEETRKKSCVFVMTSDQEAIMEVVIKK